MAGIVAQTAARGFALASPQEYHGAMASRPGCLRTLSSVSLIGALVLLLGIPLCAEEVCPMGERAAKAACEELGRDCCQQSGVTVPHFPVPAPPPGPAIAAAPTADTPTPSPTRI